MPVAMQTTMHGSLHFIANDFPPTPYANTPEELMSPLPSDFINSNSSSCVESSRYETISSTQTGEAHTQSVVSENERYSSDDEETFKDRIRLKGAAKDKARRYRAHKDALDTFYENDAFNRYGPSLRPPGLEPDKFDLPLPLQDGPPETWIPGIMFRPPSPRVDLGSYPTTLTQPYYENLNHDAAGFRGTTPDLPPTKAELTYFQGVVAPTLDHLPAPLYPVGEHPKLFQEHPRQTINSGLREEAALFDIGSPVLCAEGDSMLPEEEQDDIQVQRPRSEFGEKYRYHPALRHLRGPELARSRAEFGMADGLSEVSETPDQEYQEGPWEPPSHERPTTIYDGISADGQHRNIYVDDFSSNCDNDYPNTFKQGREALVYPYGGINVDEIAPGTSVPQDVERPSFPSPCVDENVSRETVERYIPSSSWIPMNELQRQIEYKYMEKLFRGDPPSCNAQAHQTPPLKRKLDEDETTSRKKQRISAHPLNIGENPLTLPHEYDEDLEYVETVTESYSAHTGKLSALATGWELRRRRNASWRNQRRGKVFSRSQSPSASSVVENDSRLVDEGNTLVDNLDEASSNGPTMINNEQEEEMPEAETPYLSDKGTSQQPVQPAETQNVNGLYENATVEPSVTQDQPDHPIQVPAAMPRQRPEVVFPPLSPELRDQYIEYVYISKKNKGSPGKGASRRPRGSSVQGQNKKTEKKIILKCDRVTRSTPVKQKCLMKLDIDGKQAEPWDGQRDSSGGSPTKPVRASKSKSKEPVARVLSKASRITKRITQAC